MVRGRFPSLADGIRLQNGDSIPAPVNKQR